MTVKCLNCGMDCDRDEVDVGVGVIYGPYGCNSCGWSEAPEYDSSNGPSPKQQENPGYIVDPQGGMQKKSAVLAKLDRLGVDTTDLNL
jgi:hypothetical protein